MFQKDKLIKILIAEVERKDKIILELMQRIVKLDLIGSPKESIELSGTGKGMEINLDSLIGEVIHREVE